MSTLNVSCAACSSARGGLSAAARTRGSAAAAGGACAGSAGAAGESPPDSAASCLRAFGGRGAVPTAAACSSQVLRREGQPSISSWSLSEIRCWVKTLPTASLAPVPREGRSGGSRGQGASPAARAAARDGHGRPRAPVGEDSCSSAWATLSVSFAQLCYVISKAPALVFLWEQMAWELCGAADLWQLLGWFPPLSLAVKGRARVAKGASDHENSPCRSQHGQDSPSAGD